MIYLDNAATTKPCREAVDAVADALCEHWGNPSSSHRAGLDASKLVESARAAVLSSLGVRGAPRADGDAVVFCGSGTEANNLAILGVCRSKSRRGRVIITEGEHASVENAASEAAREDFDVVRIPTRGGVIDADALASAATPDTVLVSVMLVNSETGALYDAAGAFRAVRAAAPNAICHIDAVQAYMKTPFSVGALGADLCTVSAHKIHGPKGIAALYVSRSVLRSRSISPVIFGGGQEYALRSGTVNVPAVAGFAAAIARASSTRDADASHMRALREYLIHALPEIGARPNLPPNAAPHILSVTVPDIKSETILNYLSSRGICLSSGSACSTHSRTVSRALLAFGLTEREADSTVRVSLSRSTTEDECRALLDALADAVRTLARMK